MVRPLQKRKRRSSRPTIRQSQHLKRPINPLGNDLIAKNWNKKETLMQNYRRLGLVSRLKTPTGGIERGVREKPRSRSVDDAFAIAPTANSVVKEVRVERDADGRIILPSLRASRPNPLSDRLNEVETDSGSEDGDDNDEYGEDGEEKGEWGGINDESRPHVVQELERQSMKVPAPRLRYQSEAEREWLAKLVAKHGDNVAAMAKDRKLNPMQQTEKDIAKRMRKLVGS